MRKLTTVLFFLGIALTSNPVYSVDMQDYGKIWTAWGKDGQTAYIWGFIDGGAHALQTVMSEIIVSDKRGGKVPKSFYENIRLKTATLYDENKIIDVVTNLYKDPANSYIWFNDMIYIACDSLSGKDVSKAILEARKAAMINYELNKKMEGK
jgi:hypothetical protein